jgi:hypothetical protein
MDDAEKFVVIWSLTDMARIRIDSSGRRLSCHGNTHFLQQLNTEWRLRWQWVKVIQLQESLLFHYVQSTFHIHRLSVLYNVNVPPCNLLLCSPAHQALRTFAGKDQFLFCAAAGVRTYGVHEVSYSYSFHFSFFVMLHSVPLFLNVTVLHLSVFTRLYTTDEQTTARWEAECGPRKVSKMLKKWGFEKHLRIISMFASSYLCEQVFFQHEASKKQC